MFETTKEKIKQQRVLTGDDKLSTMPNIVEEGKEVKMQEEEYREAINNVFTQFNNSFFCDFCHARDDHLRYCMGSMGCLSQEYHASKLCLNKSCYTNVLYSTKDPSKDHTH